MNSYEWWQWVIVGLVLLWAIWRVIGLFTTKSRNSSSCRSSGPCAGCTLADTCRKNNPS